MHINEQEIAQLLISSSPEGILIVNQKGFIQSANPSLLKMFGYNSEEELVGQRLEILIPARFKDSHVAHRERFVKKPAKRRMGTEKVLYGKRVDGSEFAVEVGLNYIKSEKGILVSALVSDISERVEMQEKLEKLNAQLEGKVEERTQELENAILELQDANKTLEEQFELIQKAEMEARNALEKEKELNELKSRFVSMASHEFRTPLSTVLSSNSLIKKYLGKLNTPDYSTSEKISKHTSKIQKSVNNLNEILEDLLSLGKLEEGKINVKKSKFEIKELLDEIVEDMSTYLKPNQEIIIKKEVNQTVYTDKHLLNNVLLNLISNASKYSEDGKKITLNSYTSNNLLKIEIQDEGIGIPQEDVPHMFERFFRAKNVTNIQGTGLGLNIVKKYVELIGGNINFTSELNVGSTFTLEIEFNKNDN